MTFDVAAALTSLGDAGQLVVLLIVGVPLVVLAAFRTSETAPAAAARVESRETLRSDR